MCGIIIDGRVAEWLMALVLKTSVRKYRKFESCPFRHISANLGVFLIFVGESDKIKVRNNTNLRSLYVRT